MSISQVTTRDTQLEKQRIGKPQLSLTNFSNTLEPAVAAGSVIEVGGSLYTVTVDEAITGWAGIGNDTDCYIKMVPGSPMTAAFVTAAPTWSHAKQGWYVGNDRYVAGLHRGATSAAYEDKWVYQRSQDNSATHRFYGGDVDINDDLDVGGAVTITSSVVAGAGRKVAGYLHGDITWANVYAGLAGDMVVGDTIIISGACVDLSGTSPYGQWWFSRAYRENATTIRLYGLFVETAFAGGTWITYGDAIKTLIASTAGTASGLSLSW